jgi:hypothetical protein
MWWDLATVCKDCLLFNGSVLYLLYGLVVLAASLTPFDLATRAQNVRHEQAGATVPPLVGELGEFSKPRVSIGALLLIASLGVASFKFFQFAVSKVLSFVRTVFLVGDNPTFLVSLRRYLFFYFLAIPLPAAFMAPVAYAQRKPDFQLLSAILLLIFINALGDAISIRVTLKNFETLKFEKTSIDDSSADNFWASVRNEALYYFAVVKGTLYSLAVLAFVLAFSSVLYGVQIGQLDFALSKEFFAGAWERVLQFPGLAFEFYWFRDQPGPFGLPGIPGLFLYGLTTFVPIIILFCLALLWLILLPLRIAINLPANRTLRVVSSEFAVVVVCVVASFTLQINVLSFYSFLMHTWTTW